MKISKKEVERLSHLARIELTKEEEKKFTKELSSILEYFEKLKELKTDEVEITSSVSGLENIEREDKIVEFEEKNRLLKNAPEVKNKSIKVKSVF